MKICVIGFGATGILSARYASVDHDCTVFERTDSLGGTWVYTDKTGIDDDGLPLHTSMYKNLRTNVPKEVMGFSDFSVPECKKKFLTHQEVLEFLKSYVQHFDLNRLVKFRHIVEEVTPENNEWKVQVKNSINNELKIYYFDAVMVCNGHHSVPFYPQIPGISTFTGYQIHSHDYRRPEDFKDKIVLVVGGSYSGIDITLDILSQASKIFLSCRRAKPKCALTQNVQVVSEVEEIRGNTIVFKNEENFPEKVDAIIFCTGYSFSFPFLSPDCGIKIEDEYVSPLFKQIININHPTMAFIGIPSQAFLFPLFEIQVKCFLKSLSDISRLPSKEEMLSDMKRRESAILAKEQTLRWCHLLYDDVKPYLDDLAGFGGLEPLPDSLYEYFNETISARTTNLLNWRSQFC